MITFEMRTLRRRPFQQSDSPGTLTEREAASIGKAVKTTMEGTVGAKMRRGRIGGIGLVWFLLAVVGWAQTHQGSIRGEVTDPTGQPLRGATIELVQEETGRTRTSITGGRGEFVFSLLPPGPYRLVLEQRSTNRKYVSRVVLLVNQDLRVALAFTAAPTTETVEVVESLTPLKKDGASLGAVVDNPQVVGLPLDGRNFLELSLLVAGAVPAAPGSAGSVRGDFAFNINGAREDANNFLLDGVYNVDPKLNAMAVRPPVDGVREFELLTNAYDASFGRSAGAQVNVVLKSGSNQFHGTVYHFLRNQVFDARNYFAPASEPDPRYQRNQGGFALGGPIRRDRTFFFGDYEGTRLREAITRLGNVPTAEERRGDFSAGRFGQPLIPGTTQLFPGGQIPAQFLHPVGRRIADLYPLPNRASATQNFVSSPILRDRNDHVDFRIDHLIGDRLRLSGRYSLGDRTLFEPFSAVTLVQVPGYGNHLERRGQNAMLGLNQVVSSSLVHDFRIAFNRVAGQVRHENAGRSVNQSVGMPELSTNPRAHGLSFITITGYSPLGDEYNNPQQSVTNVFQVLDTASWARGSHLVKFGFDVRVAQQNGFRDVQSRGFLNFSSQIPITRVALADLLLGLPALTGGARLDNHQHLRTESYNLFVNDSYRIGTRLTLSAGVRYEYNSPPVDRFDRANLFDVGTGQLVRVGTAGMPRSGYGPDRNNLAPRVGLAWTLGRAGRTVLRSGYGVYYDQAPLAPGEALYFNAPYFDLNFYFSLPGLPLTLANPFPASFPFPLPKAAFGFDSQLRTAYAQHWNVIWQQELGRNRAIEIGYVGSKGTKLLSTRDFNQPRPSARQPNPRLNPRFDEISLQGSMAASNYHALQATFQQRLVWGGSALAGYTWGKSIDNASGIFASAGDPNYPQDSANLRAERARSNFDVRHRFSLGTSWELPFGKGKTWWSTPGLGQHLLGGWQADAILLLQTGRPFTVALLPEFDNSNTGRANLGFGANDRPNLIGSARIDRPTPERWFNPAAFRVPAYGSFGNAGRNLLDGPGFQNLNMALRRSIALGERASLQLRGEVFNLFNHPNFGLPDNFVGSPSFGSIASAESPRRIQWGIKILF